MNLRSAKPLRRLVLDVENRPLSYWYDGGATAEITVIAAKWHGQKRVHCWALGLNVDSPGEMLRNALSLYDQADAVIAHNGTHDLGLLLAACVENGLPPLKPTLLIDTYKGLARWRDLPKSLEYLADFLGCPVQKPMLSQHKWREANRLTTEKAIRVAVDRCKSDVLATEWIYEEEMRRGLLLHPPRRWAP